MASREGHEVLQPDREPSVHAFPKPPYQQADAATLSYVKSTKEICRLRYGGGTRGMTCHPHTWILPLKKSGNPYAVCPAFYFTGWIKKKGYKIKEFEW